jgi:hypothetical protein
MSLPPYPFTVAEQLTWYDTFKQTLIGYIDNVHSEYDSYMANPSSHSLNKTYKNMKEMAEQVDSYLSAAIELVRPFTAEDEILDLLRKMVLEVKPHITTGHSKYVTLRTMYLKALPSIPSGGREFVPAEGQEGFWIH